MTRKDLIVKGKLEIEKAATMYEKMGGDMVEFAKLFREMKRTDDEIIRIWAAGVR